MAAIPVHLLTGFLGSGKTTLLNRLLRSPEFADCAVLVNEFGEVAVDHHLIEAVHGDVVLLKSGCVCCSVRGDLAEAIRALHERREAGAIPPFARMMIETTGLADPTPVLATLMHERVIRHHFRVAGVLTTVDAVNGAAQLARFREAQMQVAVADRLVITKTDLAPPAQVDALRAQLALLNMAAVVVVGDAALPASALLVDAEDAPEAGTANTATAWLPGAHRSLAQAGAGRHSSGIASFVLELPPQIDWTVFGVWLSLLLHHHGDRVLRVKGLLDVAGSDRPVLVQGVQRLIHPPLHLPRWPDGPRRSQLVVIVRDLEAEPIRASLATFQRALKRRPSALEAA